jgi:hypothetical protein
MQTVRDIEFVSYDGAWPCLCMGTLTLRVEGKEVKMKGGLCSGGTCCCGFDGDDDVVTEGDWTVNFECFPVEFSELEQKIVTDLVNENVPHGCCGGCL